MTPALALLAQPVFDADEARACARQMRSDHPARAYLHDIRQAALRGLPEIVVLNPSDEEIAALQGLGFVVNPCPGAPWRYQVAWAEPAPAPARVHGDAACGRPTAGGLTRYMVNAYLLPDGTPFGRVQDQFPVNTWRCPDVEAVTDTVRKLLANPRAGAARVEVVIDPAHPAWAAGQNPRPSQEASADS